MPIRPENRDRYPASWGEISRRIRFDRAGGQCECEGECGTDHEAEFDDVFVPADGGPTRCQAEHDWPHPITDSFVVLTVAHLDHTPENCDDANLVAMCQRCHNRYDAPTRRQGIRDREIIRTGQTDLFKEPTT